MFIIVYLFFFAVLLFFYICLSDKEIFFLLLKPIFNYIVYNNLILYKNILDIFLLKYKIGALIVILFITPLILYFNIFINKNLFANKNIKICYKFLLMNTLFFSLSLLFTYIVSNLFIFCLLINNQNNLFIVSHLKLVFELFLNSYVKFYSNLFFFINFIYIFLFLFISLLYAKTIYLYIEKIIIFFLYLLFFLLFLDLISINYILYVILIICCIFFFSLNLLLYFNNYTYLYIF